MKKLFIIANWKSYKTETEAIKWLQEFQLSNFGSSPEGDKLPISNGGEGENKEIIICPPVTLLSPMREYIDEHTLPITLGAQNISPFDEGRYTGEINGKQIKEFAKYVIIGHSERRDNFDETNELLVKKVAMANKYELIPIFCIQGKETNIHIESGIVAYEPVAAIGSGNPDTPEDAQKIAFGVKEKNAALAIVYGGSVTSENVNLFTSQSAIHGVLVGGASLDPQEFSQIIKNA